MVLFNVNSMPSPATSYHIITDAASVDPSGNVLSTSLLTITPDINVAMGTTPNYKSVSQVINGSVVSTRINETPLSMIGISLIMSDGTTKTIFDNVYTGLNTLEFMMRRNQYYLMASDDIMLINVDGVKLLILETTFMNQKLMNSFSFHYIRGKVRCIHRNLATIMDLADALISVGYQKNTSVAFANNYDLQDILVDVNRPRIQIFDLYYVANPTSSTAGSALEDSPAINYI